MAVQVGMAATQLVIGNNLPPGFPSHTVKHFKVVVGAARPSVKKKQRGTATGGLPYYSVIMFDAKILFFRDASFGEMKNVQIHSTPSSSSGLPGMP